MKKIITLLTFLCLTAFYTFAQTTTTTYNFNNISGINAGSVFKINISPGNSKKVVVDCPKEYKDYLTVTENNGTVIFKLELPKNFNYKRRNVGDIIVNMEISEIKNIKLSGASSLTGNGDFNGDNISIVTSGASAINKLNLSGYEINLDCSGASSLNINGDFIKCELDLSGATNMIFTGNIKDFDCELSGAANLKYNGDTDVMDIDASGASKAVIIGKGNEAKLECSGASYINGKEYIINNATLEATGGSKINIFVNESLKADASSGSVINYYGNPKNIITKPSNIRKAD